MTRSSTLPLFALGMIFFFVGTLTGYYMVFVQIPLDGLTELIISSHVHLLHMGYLLTMAAVILPLTGFPGSVVRPLAYLISISAILFVAGYYLLAGESPLWLPLFMIFGPLLTVVTAIIAAGHLGLGGRRVGRGEIDRIAMLFLALMFTASMVFGLWMATIAAAERSVPTDLYVLHTHAMHYAIWGVVAAVIMRASKPNERLYRLIILGIIAASLFWSILFGVYVSGAPIQMAAGGMDALLGIAILATLLSLWGLFGERGRFTPGFALGTVSLLWVMIAGGIGLFLAATYTGMGLDLPREMRVLHSINAEWSMAAGIGAVGLIAARSQSRLGWVAVLAFSGGMIKSIVGYSLEVMHSEFATPLLRIGEPFMSLAFLVTAFIVFTAPHLRTRRQ